MLKLHLIMKVSLINAAASFLAAVTFLEYWKRKSASLAHHWDCMGFQEEEERPRPDFAAKAPYLEKNPITGVRKNWPVFRAGPEVERESVPV